MAKPVIILHGWSDNSRSFVTLGQWLRSNGFDVVDIILGDYLSMNDEISLFDLGLAFQRALAANNISTDHYSFDAVVHSTGGLVIREFLRQICAGDATRTPIKRLLMLSPANFGSPLATLGKSVLGRMFKGWSWDHAGQSGQQVLDALELASPYAWGLAESDLFDSKFRIYDPANVLTTVIGGTAAYADTLSRSMHENGSDGTVRVSTANLNAHYLKVSFQDPAKPQLTTAPRSCPQLAFAVLDRDHTAIHDPFDNRQADLWKKLVLASLTLEPAGYPAHVANCAAAAAQTFDTGMKSSYPDRYHQYQHVAFRVHDQFGHPVDDYVVEFYQETGDDKDTAFEQIHSEILEKITTNSTDSSYRSFLFDITDLNTYLQRSSAEIDMSVTAANISPLIRYQNPPGGIPVFAPKLKDFIFPNEPVLVDVLLNRSPSPDVFKLSHA